jgi:hypothetical protein
VSEISVEARTNGDPEGRETPNCVDCSRSVAHRVCSVLHLLDGAWVVEHGSHWDKLPVRGARPTAGTA